MSDQIVTLLGAPSPAQGPMFIPGIIPADTNPDIVLNQQGNPAILILDKGYLVGGSAQPSYRVALDGQEFALRVTGKVTTKAACNVTVAIHVGTTTTYTSGQVIATTGAKSVGTTSANFSLEARCIWDIVTGKIQGRQIGVVNNSIVAAAALTNAVAVTASSGLTFELAVTFSDTTAGTEMTISEFSAYID